MIPAVIVSIVGGLVSGYGIGIISGVLNDRFFLDYFHHPSDVALESLAAALFSAGALGCFLVGETADTSGRRRSIIATAVVLSLGCILQTAPLACHTHLAVIWIGRAMVGLATGGLNTNVPLYIGEVAPTSHRGMIGSAFAMANASGILAAYSMNYAVLPHQVDGWKVSLASQLPFALLFLLVSFTLPESPRWLLLRDDEDGARRELRKLRSESDQHVEEEMRTLITSCRAQPAASWTQVPGAVMEWNSVISIALIVFTNSCGADVITQFASEILGEGNHGVHLMREPDDLKYTVWVGISIALSSVLPLFAIDSLGRRPLLAAGTICQTLSMALLAIGFSCKLTGFARSLMHIGPLITFNIGFSIWCPLALAVPAELLHTKVRAKLMGAGWALSWATDYFCVRSFLSARAYLGEAGVFAGYAVFNAVGCIFFMAYVPETLGCELDTESIELLAAEKQASVPAADASKPWELALDPVPPVGV